MPQINHYRLFGSPCRWYLGLHTASESHREGMTLVDHRLCGSGASGQTTALGRKLLFAIFGCSRSVAILSPLLAAIQERPQSPALICSTASAKVKFQGRTGRSPREPPRAPLGRKPSFAFVFHSSILRVSHGKRIFLLSKNSFHRRLPALDLRPEIPRCRARIALPQVFLQDVGRHAALDRPRRMRVPKPMGAAALGL